MFWPPLTVQQNAVQPDPHDGSPPHSAAYAVPGSSTVWDVATARAVAATPGCLAIATASHSIAEAHGYEDGENIPLDLMLAAVERIVQGVDLPVTADLKVRAIAT